MTGTALVLYSVPGVPGAWLGAASLTMGVCVEALAARCLAAKTLRRLLATGASAPADAPSPPVPVLSYSEILRFYYPLALTSMIGLASQPMLTFFMGRARAPLESLAVFPVVHALSFLFRTVGISYQEAAIALMDGSPLTVRRWRASPSSWRWAQPRAWLWSRSRRCSAYGSSPCRG